MAVVFENSSRLKSKGALGVSIESPDVCEPCSRKSVVATKLASRVQTASPSTGAGRCHVDPSTRQMLAARHADLWARLQCGRTNVRATMLASRPRKRNGFKIWVSRGGAARQ